MTVTGVTEWVVSASCGAVRVLHLPREVPGEDQLHIVRAQRLVVRLRRPGQVILNDLTADTTGHVRLDQAYIWIFIDR